MCSVFPHSHSSKIYHHSSVLASSPIPGQQLSAVALCDQIPCLSQTSSWGLGSQEVEDSKLSVIWEFSARAFPLSYDSLLTLGSWLLASDLFSVRCEYFCIGFHTWDHWFCFKILLCTSFLLIKVFQKLAWKFSLHCLVSKIITVTIFWSFSSL